MCPALIAIENNLKQHYKKFTRLLTTYKKLFRFLLVTQLD